MAIPLNKFALLCEKIAFKSGSINKASSAQPLLYDISRNWRALLDASNFRSDAVAGWKEKEVVAADVILSAVAYLKRIECKDIERLLRDTVRQQLRRNT